jgi:hypothetical protein
LGDAPPTCGSAGASWRLFLSRRCSLQVAGLTTELAREILAERVKSGEPVDGHQIDICDEAGAVLVKHI